MKFSDQETPKSTNWWKRKKKIKVNHDFDRKINDFPIKEFIGDKRIYGEKPRAWESSPQVGMDKIRGRTNVGKYFVDFASSSTVHGFNHLTAPHRHPFEKFLTVLFIVGALLSLIFLSFNFWDRYQTEATIFVLDNDFRSFAVPKPAIMICPNIKHNENKFEEVFARHNIENTPEARNFFAFIANATYREFADTPLYDKVPPEKWLTILWELLPNFLVMAGSSKNETARIWIVTEKGFCIMMGSYVATYTTYEYWINNNWTIVEPPSEIATTIYKFRSEVISYNTGSDEGEVTSHNAFEIPEFEKIGINMVIRTIKGMAIITQETKTSDAVKSLAIHQRKCKIWQEGGLKMWPIYSRFMCTLECKYELIRKVCGCYPHFARPMPEIPICTASQLRCLGEHYQEFKTINSTESKKCGCLPVCDTTIYQDNDSAGTILKEGSPKDASLTYHVDFPLNTVRRELFFGFNDLMTSIGGAAGLFLGASVISFVEIFYYGTLRLFWYRNSIKKQQKKTSKS